MGKTCFRGIIGALWTAGLGLATASPAQAAGSVLTGVSGSPAVTEVRVARAASPERARHWVQYRLNGKGRAAIVTPAAAGTFVDPVPDAWFEALEAGTALRIVPPVALPACGNGAGKVHVTGDLSHVATLPPSEVAVLGGPGDVEAFAGARDLWLKAPTLEALSAQGGPFVALVYESAGGVALTEGVRFVSPGSPEPIPLGLLEASGDEPDVTLWTIGGGRAAIAGVTEHTPDAVGFSWLAHGGKSDYVERRRELLQADHGAAWLIEMTGTAPLLQLGVLPDQGGAIPPVAFEYFSRAALAGAAPTPPEDCVASVWDAHADAKNGAALSERCPPGTLAIVPGGSASCDDAPAAGEIDSGSLVCGSADDLAHAFAGGRLDRARITRHRSVIGVDTTDPQLDLFDGTALPRVLTASDVDATGCNLGGGGNGGSGSVTGSGAYSGSGSSGQGGSYYSPEPDDEYETHTDVTVSCWGSSEPSSEGDSCSGDSSSSSESDDSCSGDSSSSSEGDSCGGDSSDGADGSDACSGDSSDSGGDACSGDSSSGADSGCSGDTGGGSGDCSVTDRKPRRVRLQLWLLVGSLVAFGARRAGRSRARL